MVSCRLCPPGARNTAKVCDACTNARDVRLAGYEERSTEREARVARLTVERDEAVAALSGRTVSCVCGGDEIERLRLVKSAVLALMTAIDGSVASVVLLDLKTWSALRELRRVLDVAREERIDDET